HLKLAVIGHADGIPFERPRGRTFEVDAVLVKTAAVAGAFKFLFCFEPVWRASQVRADRLEGKNHRLSLELITHDPYAELGNEFRLDLARRQRVGKADLKPGWRLDQDVRKHETGQPQEPHQMRGSQRRET